jgi:hypothetical protein
LGSRATGWTSLSSAPAPALTFRFVSDVDGTAFVEAPRDIDMAETLFIDRSKPFMQGGRPEAGEELKRKLSRQDRGTTILAVPQARLRRRA